MAEYSGAYADGAPQREPWCPVCMALLRNQPVGIPECCDHQFCLPCIREWANSVNTCPIDRMSFNIIRCHSTVKNGVPYKTIRVDNRTLPSADDPTFCEVCRKCNLENQLLLCDGCDRGYHLRCLNPPLNAVPRGEWYCTRCLRIISSAMRSRTAQTSTSPKPSSSTDSGDRPGSRGCRKDADHGCRKDNMVSVVVQGAVSMGRAHGRRASGGSRLAQVQLGVPETSLTGDKTDDKADSDVYAVASDKDDDSEVDDSDENERSDDDDSDEDYHPGSVKGQMTRGRRVHVKRAKGRLTGRKRGVGRKLTGKVEPDGRQHRIDKKVQSLRKSKGKMKGRKAKKSTTALLVKTSRVVLQPLQPAALSQLPVRRRSSGLHHDSENAGKGETTGPGPSKRPQATAGTDTSGAVVVRHRSHLLSTARNKCGDSKGNVECSDDASASSLEECPQLLQEADGPILNSTESPPLLDMQCEAVGACSAPACDTIASEQRSNATVSRISRHTKSKGRGKSRVCNRSSSTSTATVASSAATNLPAHVAVESSVPQTRKGSIKTKGRSTLSGSDKKKVRVPFSIVLPLGTSEMPGRNIQSVDNPVAVDKAPPVSVMNEAYDALSETATTSQAAVTQMRLKRCTKKSSVKASTPQSRSDGQVLVSSSPGSSNGLLLSAVTHCDNQRNTAASESSIGGTTEATVSALGLVRESADASFAERSTSGEPALAEVTASATITTPVTSESHRGSMMDSASNGKHHLSFSKSLPASSGSRLPFPERAVPAAEGIAPPCVTTVGGEKAAFSDAPGPSRRSDTTDGNALAESSKKLVLSFRKVRRGPRTPSPPPPSSSDDDSHRSRSPVSHRPRPSLASISVAAAESSVGSAATASSASSVLSVEDSGADNRVPAPKATTEHKRISPTTETFAAGSQSAYNCPMPEHDSSKGAAKKGNEVDSQKECVRFSEASAVSKSSTVSSDVARETIFENRIYYGHYRAKLDSRVSLGDADHSADTGDAHGRSSGGFTARYRASDAHRDRGFDRVSDPNRSRTAYRYTNRGDTLQEQCTTTAESGWSSHAVLQYNRSVTRTTSDHFNRPTLRHSDMRQSSGSRYLGRRRAPLLPDPVSPTTTEHLGRVDCQPSANGYSCTTSTGDYSVESDEWAEGDSDNVDCEAFVGRYERGEVAYEYNYEDDGGYNEVDGDYHEVNGGYDEVHGIDGVCDEVNGAYDEVNGVDGVYDEVHGADGVYYDIHGVDGVYDEGGVDGVYDEGGVYDEDGVDGVYDEGDGIYDEVYDGGENYCDDSEICEDITSVHYDLTEPNGEVGTQFIANGGGLMVASREMQTLSTRSSSRAQWGTRTYDGADGTRHGNFPAAGSSRSSGRGLLPLPADSSRWFPSYEARRDSRVVGRTVSSQPPTQWLAGWLQMQNMQSSPAVTPALSVYRGTLPLNPGGQSFRQGLRSSACQRASPAAASSSGSRGLLDPFVALPSSWFDNVTRNCREPQWRPPMICQTGSVPRDPRVRPGRVESSISSAVPAAAPLRHNDPPSSASAAGFTRKMGNPECNDGVSNGESSRSIIVPEAGSRADKFNMNANGTSTTPAAAEGLKSRDAGGSPMVLSAQCSPIGATSPDTVSVVSVAVSRTPSPSAFCSGNGQPVFRCNPAASTIASAAFTTGSTSAETSSGVVAVGGSAAASSDVTLAISNPGNAATSLSPTAAIISSLPAAAATKPEDHKVREIAVIVERLLMGPHMAGRIDTVTYKAIAKKAVSKIYKQEKGGKLDESRIQKLVEAYVREADLPDMPRLK